MEHDIEATIAPRRLLSGEEIAWAWTVVVWLPGESGRRAFAMPLEGGEEPTWVEAKKASLKATGEWHRRLDTDTDTCPIG